MKTDWSFKFRILIKREDDLWIAHCLELDLVAAAPTEQQVEKDIVTAIIGQVRYCLANDNMDYLWITYFEAPQRKYGKNTALVSRQEELRRPLIQGPPTLDDVPAFSFTASACRSLSACHA